MRIIGTNGDDWLQDTAGDDLIRAGAGNDTVYLSSGDDSVYLGDGNDFMTTGSGAHVRAYGEAGDDYLDLHQADSGVGYGGDGNDFIIGAIPGFNLLDGGNGNDFITAWNGNDALFGGNGSDYLHGGNGNDELWGDTSSAPGLANDGLYGGAGDDMLRGGRGVDLLQGDDQTTRWETRVPGADRFVFDDFDTGFGSSRDVILDFTPAEGDRIDLSLIDANWYLAGDQPFIFHGTYPNILPGVTAAVWAFRSGADVIIQGSTDGDSFAELEIGLRNFSGTLSTGDFIL
jgi:Ca2+-binding RTX toxin-like protein